MKPKFTRSLAALVVCASASALAQTGGASKALPAAPGTPNDPPAMAANAGASKLAVINIEGAIFASNEGQRDMDALQKKFDPKSTELKTKSDEIDQLKKKLTTQGGSLNDDAKAELQRDIDTKQKALDREAQDAREDFQNEQNAIGQRILQKMAPLITKYVQENGIGMLVDTSNPWPQGPVVYAAQTVDITPAIVSQYNVQSGVAAPPKSGATTGSSRPAGAGAAPHAAAPSAKTGTGSGASPNK